MEERAGFEPADASLRHPVSNRPLCDHSRPPLRAPPEIRTRILFLLREAPLPVGLEGQELRAADRLRTGDLDVGNVVLWPAELQPHRASTEIRTRSLVLTKDVL
jgi:hypothetical protein